MKADRISRRAAIWRLKVGESARFPVQDYEGVGVEVSKAHTRFNRARLYTMRKVREDGVVEVTRIK